MAAFTTAAVSARTTSGCTVTFNAAAIDCSPTQIQQLAKLFAQLAIDMSGQTADDSSATVTIGALG